MEDGGIFSGGMAHHLIESVRTSGQFGLPLPLGQLLSHLMMQYCIVLVLNVSIYLFWTNSRVGVWYLFE
jgi:hypothetical protein